jgi:preprotein translocase subunit SecY
VRSASPSVGSVLCQTGTCKVPLLYFQGPSIPGLPRVVRKEIDHIPFKAGLYNLKL